MYKFILVSILSIIAASCGNAPQPTETTETAAAEQVRLTAQQQQNAGIETGKPERRAMHTFLQVNGMVELPPQGRVSVSFPLGGYLKSTKLLPGMPVRKGEVLAVLEDVQYIQLQQDYLMAKAKLPYATAELKRQEDLQSGQAGSAKALQQAQADYAGQQVLLKALGEKLLLIGINPATLDENSLSRSVALRAPIDGFVSAVLVNIGKYVNPADVLFELVNPKDLHLSLKVFEKDAPALRVGQRIEAYTNDRPDQPYSGKIHLISRHVDAERAVEVHGHFDRYDSALLPGMFMNARLEVTRQDALAVPESAVVRWENRHFVFVKNASGGFDMQEIQTGAAENGFIQILPMGENDLSQATLVLKNAYALLMKLKNAPEE